MQCPNQVNHGECLSSWHKWGLQQWNYANSRSWLVLQYFSCISSHNKKYITKTTPPHPNQKKNKKSIYQRTATHLYNCRLTTWSLEINDLQLHIGQRVIWVNWIFCVFLIWVGMGLFLFIFYLLWLMIIAGILAHNQCSRSWMISCCSPHLCPTSRRHPHGFYLVVDTAIPGIRSDFQEDKGNSEVRSVLLSNTFKDRHSAIEPQLLSYWQHQSGALLESATPLDANDSVSGNEIWRLVHTFISCTFLCGINQICNV